MRNVEVKRLLRFLTMFSIHFNLTTPQIFIIANGVFEYRYGEMYRSDIVEGFPFWVMENEYKSYQTHS